MNDNIKKINYDDKDPKLMQIRQEFLSEIKKRFNCKNFDEIIKYVFDEVFKNKSTKETCIEEFKSIFEDKTESMMNFLWSLIDRVATAPQGDVLEEIYREKNEQKKFPSQIVNPSSNKPSNQQSNDSQSNRDYHRNNRDRDSRRRDSRDYHDYHDYKDRDNNYRNNKNRSNKFNTGDRMRVGNKEIILHGGNKLERSRSKDNNYPAHMQRDKDDDAQYDDNYHYPQNYRGGYYQQRRGGPPGGYPMPFNPYYQNYPPMMRFPNQQRRPKQNQFQKKQKEDNTSQDIDQEQSQTKNEGQEQQVSQGNVEENQGEQIQRPPREPGNKPEEGTEGDGQKKKIRCKNWPGCKDPSCGYTHPTQTCPFFPNCMFGDKCSFIHPNIPCKYKFYCTRIGCAYSHPPGWNPGMGMYPNMMQPVPYFKHKNKKFGGNNRQQANQGQGHEDDQGQPQQSIDQSSTDQGQASQGQPDIPQ